MADKLRQRLIVILVVVILIAIVLGLALGRQPTVESKPNQTTVENVSEVVEQPTEEQPDSTPESYISGSVDKLLETKESKGIEVMESIAACYNTDTTSEYNYTGVPQVDNCIHTLIGSGVYKLLEDCADTIDSVPVHLYIIDVDISVYSIIYYPDMEAIAIPLNMTTAEYYAGAEPSDFDASAVMEE